jgi:hypothetical protein
MLNIPQMTPRSQMFTFLSGPKLVFPSGAVRCSLVNKTQSVRVRILTPEGIKSAVRQPKSLARSPRALNATTVAEGIVKPKIPIATPNSLFLNHCRIRPGADTTTIAPPTPSNNLQICRKAIEVEMEHNKELAVVNAVPHISKALTPYLSARTPPGIARRQPGKATSHIRLLAEVNPSRNSLMSVGNNGGAACIANRKENWAKKPTSNARRFSEHKASILF